MREVALHTDASPLLEGQGRRAAGVADPVDHKGQVDYMGRGVQHHAPHQETSATPETPEELVGPHIGVGDFTVPMEVITQTSAIPCLKGSGKTHTSAICIEETLRLHVPALVNDPLGARDRLRWSPDGKRPDLPVVVFGGAR